LFLKEQLKDIIIISHLVALHYMYRESVLFIGTQFSNLYTAVDTQRFFLPVGTPLSLSYKDKSLRDVFIG
jgi:hypothetical protein